MEGWKNVPPICIITRPLYTLQKEIVPLQDFVLGTYLSVTFGLRAIKVCPNKLKVRLTAATVAFHPE